MLMGRSLRTTLDLMKAPSNPVWTPQMTQMKEQYDKGVKERKFEVGQQVYLRSYQSRHEKWIPGVILEKVGSNTYRVHYGTGSRMAHADQIKKRVTFWEEEEDPQKGRRPAGSGAPQPGRREGDSRKESPRRTARKRKMTEKMKCYLAEKRSRTDKHLARIGLIRRRDPDRKEAEGIKRMEGGKVHLLAVEEADEHCTRATDNHFGTSRRGPTADLGVTPDPRGGGEPPKFASALPTAGGTDPGGDRFANGELQVFNRREPRSEWVIFSRSAPELPEPCARRRVRALGGDGELGPRTGRDLRAATGRSGPHRAGFADVWGPARLRQGPTKEVAAVPWARTREPR
ncbi:hypothetical protein V3C99_018217 [Haemonchus contortus]